MFQRIEFERGITDGFKCEINGGNVSGMKLFQEMKWIGEV